MPKGIKGFQKGHPNFVTAEGRARIGVKTSARMLGVKKPPGFRGGSKKDTEVLERKKVTDWLESK